MKICYVKVSPGGNVTALVRGRGLTGSVRVAVSRAIMMQDSAVEQVAFLYDESCSHYSGRHMIMMGGEFCVNACRAAGYLWSSESGDEQVKFRSSGMNADVLVTVRDNKSQIELPLSFIRGVRKVPEGFLVDLDGIRHLVLSQHKQDHQRLIAQYGSDVPAFGMIYTTLQGATITIDPYVWVAETTTLVRETACGSGSIATAIACGLRSHNHNILDIRQPSGEVFSIGFDGCQQHCPCISLSGRADLLGLFSIEVDGVEAPLAVAG